MRDLVARATPAAVFAYQIRDAAGFTHRCINWAVAVKAEYLSLLNHKMALITNRALKRSLEFLWMIRLFLIPVGPAFFHPLFQAIFSQSFALVVGKNDALNFGE